MKDIYVYDDSNVLKNKLNIQAPDIFADAEANYVSMRLRELAKFPDNKIKKQYQRYF